MFIPGGPSEPPGSPQVAQGRQILHAAYSLDPELLASMVVILSQRPCFQVDFPTLPLLLPFPYSSTGKRSGSNSCWPGSLPSSIPSPYHGALCYL